MWTRDHKMVDFFAVKNMTWCIGLYVTLYKIYSHMFAYTIVRKFAKSTKKYCWKSWNIAIKYMSSMRTKLIVSKYRPERWVWYQLKTVCAPYFSTMLTCIFHAFKDMVAPILQCQTHLSGLYLLTINFLLVVEAYFLAIFQEFQQYFFVLLANLRTMVYANICE